LRRRCGNDEREDEKKRKIRASYRPYLSLSVEKGGSRHGRRRRKLSYPATKTQSPRAYGSLSQGIEMDLKRQFCP
jgi:hypothetical protein